MPAWVFSQNYGKTPQMTDVKRYQFSFSKCLIYFRFFNSSNRLDKSSKSISFSSSFFLGPPDPGPPPPLWLLFPRDGVEEGTAGRSGKSGNFKSSPGGVILDLGAGVGFEGSCWKIKRRVINCNPTSYHAMTYYDFFFGREEKSV